MSITWTTAASFTANNASDILSDEYSGDVIFVTPSIIAIASRLSFSRGGGTEAGAWAGNKPRSRYSISTICSAKPYKARR
jgi:hypothetical protein